ncbi:hypothetical protein DYB25_003328 [Aphanomyces astaci]|uniref:Sec20 C-terminal domain-containing protein n=1 Tax=Aphanomyces astaci TaxID=112090 RepID=A0A397ABV9_APHAT|nr:hypothetical protein DYB36_000614 [Aphanomyces astaci]RHY20376.1 hypothetical protein DYB25_003328 [Aphanomyces astaci]RHY48653.1 hypothetical protein DYB38_000340 [Aphanomyces astaci]RHY61087.1 hypothetical protein DYB30_003275 [Aphanomyces astaci]RHZ36098.1 hypothetical protein DYB26_000339 [Aphanomyces astaci]
MGQPLFERVAALLRDKTAVAAIASQEASKIQERLQVAINKLTQRIDEDPDHKAEWAREKARAETLLKQWLLAQRQRSLQQEHDELMDMPKVRAESMKATHADVHRSMERTNRALRAQIELSEEVRRRMGDGTNDLKKTHERYAEVKEKLKQTQRLLKELDHQAYMDKVWIAAGMFVFAAVVLLIIVERFPRHYIPLFWIF